MSTIKPIAKLSTTIKPMVGSSQRKMKNLSSTKVSEIFLHNSTVMIITDYNEGAVKTDI